MLKLIEDLPSKQPVVGSNPTGGVKENQAVKSSKRPGNGSTSREWRWSSRQRKGHRLPAMQPNCWKRKLICGVSALAAAPEDCHRPITGEPSGHDADCRARHPGDGSDHPRPPLAVCLPTTQRLRPAPRRAAASAASPAVRSTGRKAGALLLPAQLRPPGPRDL